jgi:hypothetical protein
VERDPQEIQAIVLGVVVHCQQIPPACLEQRKQTEVADADDPPLGVDGCGEETMQTHVHHEGQVHGPAPVDHLDGLQEDVLDVLKGDAGVTQELHGPALRSTLLVEQLQEDRAGKTLQLAWN